MARQDQQSPVRREWEDAEAARAEDRRKLIGHGPGRGGLAAYEILLILIAFAGVALAVEMDGWTQWVVVAAIVLTLLAMMINLNLRRD